MPKVKDIDLEFIQSNRHREREREHKEITKVGRTKHTHIHISEE